jgi:Tol biopolymer transport system component
MTVMLSAAMVWSLRNTVSTTEKASVQNLHVQPLTLLGDVSSGTISPDGKFIAYVRKDLGVYIRRISADNDVQVAPFVRGVVYDSVTFTPDGNFIDFAATEGTRRDLWRVPLLGGPRQRIVQQIWSSPGWSPDGRRIAFVRAGQNDETSLVVADADGTHERVLLKRHPGTMAFLNTSIFPQFGTNRPAWSPDGKRIVLAAGLRPALPSAVFATGFVISDAQTGAELLAIPMKGEDLALEATWVEDRRLLVSSITDTNSAPVLWSVDLSSDHWIPVSREFAHLSGITLAADRKSIVTTRVERRSGIWVGSTFGDEGRFVVPETPAGPTFPVLDTTGGITYLAHSGTGESTLYRLGAHESQPVIIKRRFSGTFATSPNGQFVVFSDSPSTPLYRVNADGSAPQVLVERNAGGPVITLDGKSVFYSPVSMPGLYSIPIDGGTPQQLANVTVGNTISLSPDGRRLLVQLFGPGLAMLCDLPNCTNTKQLPLKSSQWAPDGQGVAFINDEDHGNLWEQTFDNGAQHALTHFADAQILEFGWSPDYKRLVLARGRVSNDLVLLTNVQ